MGGETEEYSMTQAADVGSQHAAGCSHSRTRIKIHAACIQLEHLTNATDKFAN